MLSFCSKFQQILQGDPPLSFHWRTATVSKKRSLIVLLRSKSRKLYTSRFKLFTRLTYQSIFKEKKKSPPILLIRINSPLEIRVWLS